MCLCIPVSCSDTVSRSCIFCALVNAIEFCKMESVVDIFEVIKAIRIQKPGAIQTVVSPYNNSVHNCHDSYYCNIVALS